MANFLKEVSGVPRGTAMALTDLPSIANTTFLGNISGSASTPSALTAAQVTANLNLFTSSLQGLVSASGGGTVNFLRADGTWAAPTGTGTVTSVGMTVPAFLSVTPSTITSSGTFAVTLSGTALPILNGGTGQTTANAAFDALSPQTTKGDLITFTTVASRHAVPNDYGFLVPDSQQTDGWRNAAYDQINGRPGKNYIQYADFENNSTTGWTLGTVGTLTNGLPTGAPTFGSGASGNLSIATTSSSIEGAFSLNYASSAATTQGNMLASSSYAIDVEDQAKVLTVKFYYTAASGASNCNFSGTSSNSFAWAVYDVTNSSWLSSAGNFNLVQSSGCGYVTGTVQTNSNTANIRLVIYNANATTGAATITLDGFYVGPQTAPSGPALTDWQAYTLTIGAVTTPPTPGTVVISSAFWRRDGDSMEIQYVFEQTSAGSAGSNTYLFPLPSIGVQIDTTKINISSNVIGSGGNIVGTGKASTTNSASATVAAPVIVIPINTTNLGLLAPTGTLNQLELIASGNFGLNTTIINYAFTARVPIAGWSSNTSVSSDTDTRVVAGAAVSATATVTSSYSNITWTTINNDTHGAFNASSSASTYTIPVTGFYDISGQCFVSATTLTAGNNFTIGLLNNTTSTTLRETEYVYEGTNNTNQAISFNYEQIFLPAGTAIIMQIKATVTSSPVITASSTQNFFSIGRRSGPAVITATESVNARYYSSTTTVTSALANITYATKDFDSHNAYSSGTYTIPVSGKYQVNASILMTATTIAASELCQIQINHNGSAYSGPNDNYFSSTTTKPLTLVISDIINCAAGDTITVQASNAGSTPSISSSNSANYFSISRVGN